MSDEINKELKNAVGALREATDTIEANKAGVAEAKLKLEKAEKAADRIEEVNQKLVKELGEERKAAAELEERMKEIEVKSAKLATASFHSSPEKQALAEESKALKAWAQDTSGGRMAEYKGYLRTDSNIHGGFLVEQEYDDAIIKPITETSVIRPHVRVKRIQTNAMKLFSRATLVEGGWSGEGRASDNSESTYGQPEIHAHKLDASTKITLEELMAPKFNMESEIMSDFAEFFAQKTGASYVAGNGVLKPRGFMDSTAGLDFIASTETSAIGFDDLITMTGELKTGYKPMYSWNRKTLAAIRKLKEGDQYIWQAGNLGVGLPSEVNGFNYLVLPDMPDIATDAYPVAFCDFREMYTIVDAFQAVVGRNNNLTGQDLAKVELYMIAWFGGDVTKSEAGLKLKTTA